MPVKKTYICDNCGVEINDNENPIEVAIRGEGYGPDDPNDDLIWCHPCYQKIIHKT